MNEYNSSTEIITQDGEIIGDLPAGYSGQEASLAVSLARAEVDQQVATARALPRVIKRVVNNILSLATLDEKTAEECVYALPRAGKPIKGPSIRLAEIIASQWGNCRHGARVIHVDRVEKYVEAEGVFHDLETNAASTSRVRRRISDSKGRIFSDDMIIVTGNAACSIAKRNAILGGVPKAVWRVAYDAVEKVVAGDVKTLVERREAAMKAFAAFGVTPERVCLALAVNSLEEITLEHMPILQGARAALKSGEATVEEMFPVAGQEVKGDGPRDLKSRLDALANAQAPKLSTADGDKAAPSEGQPGQTEAQADAAAYRAGREAREKGMSRKAIPAEFKSNEKLASAWLEGFDAEGN